MLDPAWRRQVDLPEPRLRPRRQQPQVVADLRELDGAALERRGERHEDARVARRLDEVARGHERVARDGAEVPAHGGRVVRIRRDARADRRRAEVDLRQQRDELAEPRVVLAERRREAVELLAERHRHGVLQLRAPDLEHLRELRALREERPAQQVELVERLQQRVDERHLERGRVRVVRGLAAVHVVERVHVLVVAQRVAGLLERAVRDDLVGVHVGAGAGATLDHADHELVVQLPADDLRADLVDLLGLPGVEHADLHVGAGRRLLHLRERDHELRVDAQRPEADGEVLERARRVDPPVRVGGDVQAPQAVDLGPDGVAVRGRDAVVVRAGRGHVEAPSSRRSWHEVPSTLLAAPRPAEAARARG